MLTVLCLQDGVDLVLAGLTSLPPLAVRASDVAALDLDHRNADARPGNDDVGLVVLVAFLQRDGMEQRGLVRELVAQPLPDGPFGPAVLGEVRLRRIAARHVVRRTTVAA